MATYPQTGSVLYSGSNNRTGTALSTNIIILVNGTAIGAIQEISYTEQRSIQQIDEVGTDGVIDSAPNQSTKISGACQRIRFDRLRIAQAFSRGFLHVHAQRYPFDIDILDTSQGDGNNAIITTLRNVWIEQIQTAYHANNFIIIDNMNFKAETIESHFVGGNQSATSGQGPRNIPLFQDAIEQSADTGGRRGSLDAPGLIDAFTNVNAF